MAAAPDRTAQDRARRTALVCAGVVFGMTGLSFAAVPLYDLFCKVTGFGGTPKIGTAGASTVIDRAMSVRFDANVAPGLGWRFEAESQEIKLRVGETKTVFYKVTNTGNRPTTGIATYNVQPERVASFFVKIQCFCFTEQTLKPGESLEAPVVFYVDPEIAQERELDGIKAITLSYTYFPSKSGQPVVEGKVSPVAGDGPNPKL